MMQFNRTFIEAICLASLLMLWTDHAVAQQSQPTEESKKLPAGSAAERKARMAARASQPAYTKYDAAVYKSWIDQAFAVHAWTVFQIHGIGDYGASNLCMLLGRYDCLAVDTEMIRFLRESPRDGAPPDEIRAHVALKRERANYYRRRDRRPEQLSAEPTALLAAGSGVGLASVPIRGAVGWAPVPSFL